MRTLIVSDGEMIGRWKDAASYREGGKRKKEKK
jgi:hypothetical protein